MNYKELFDLAKSKGYKLTFTVPRLYAGTTLYEDLEMRQIQMWLMDEHMIKVLPCHSSVGKYNYEVFKWNNDNATGRWQRTGNISSIESYNQALYEGLNEGLKLIK